MPVGDAAALPPPHHNPFPSDAASATPAMEPVHFIATCTFGLESVVARELTDLGYAAKASTTGRVEFVVQPGEVHPPPFPAAPGSADQRESDAFPAWQVAAVRTNLWLRSADRVLICVGRFEVGGGEAPRASASPPAPIDPRADANSEALGDAAFDQLFEGVKAIPWERWIPLGSPFPVAGRCVRSRLTSEPAVQRATKRAVVERLRAAHQLGPNAMIPERDAESHDSGAVRIEVSILRDVATITIDTSGAGLHKRGYRQGTPGEAALKETLAAGLVQLSVWKPRGSTEYPPLIDPFCGSGTIAIEAALLARRIAPGLSRTFDCEHWNNQSPKRADQRHVIDPQLWARERAHARLVQRPRVSTTDHRPRIVASDIDPGAVDLARINARRAGVDRDIEFLVRDARNISSPHEHGCVITNPPYGVRVGAGDASNRPGLHSTSRGSPRPDQRGNPRLDRRSDRRSAAPRNAPPSWTGIDPEQDARSMKLRPTFGDTPAWGVHDRATEALYRALPLAFRRLKSWSFHIFTARLDLETLFGQQSTRRRKMYNSKIECCYFQFLAPKIKGQISHDEPAARDETDSAPMQAPVHVPAGVGSGPEFRGADAEEFEENAPASNPPTMALGAPVFGGLRERDEKEARELEACLVNNLRHLRKYPARGITCFRVYERDVPDVPLIIDKYEDCFHVAEYERRHSRTAAQQADWFEAMRAVIARVAGVPIEQVFMKEKHRQRGLTQHEKVDSRSHTRIVQEGGLRFEVNLSDYIDTGLFLDHRLTRQMVRDNVERLAARASQERRAIRFLNLFCYTGSFTAYAAAGAAAASTTIDTTSVDLSNTYLDWAERNLALNALKTRGSHRFIKSDVLEFLDTHARPGPGGVGGEGRYDLAVVDPPTFSNSKSTEEDWEVLHGHARVLELLGPLMAPAGVVYFSTNFRRFKLNEDAVAAAGFAAREITTQTLPPEYRNRKTHRCWRLTKN